MRAVLGAPAREDPLRAHPVRAVLRALLLVEELALHAVRIALHRQRPPFEVRQQRRRDARVVVDDLALREAGLRIEDLVQVRELERPAVDHHLERAHTGRSRTTSVGRLSSRRPLYAGWRRMPSLVHSVNSTSATSFG